MWMPTHPQGTHLWVTSSWHHPKHTADQISLVASVSFLALPLCFSCFLNVCCFSSLTALVLVCCRENLNFWVRFICWQFSVYQTALLLLLVFSSQLSLSFGFCNIHLQNSSLKQLHHLLSHWDTWHGIFLFSRTYENTGKFLELCKQQAVPSLLYSDLAQQ